MNIIVSALSKDVMTIPVIFIFWASVITWILLYIIIRYSFVKGEISVSVFSASLLIGLFMNAAMIIPMVTGLYRKMK